MGSGDWLKTIITLKKIRPSKSKNSKSNESGENPNKLNRKASGGVSGISDEGTAATRIQTAFRCHKARKILQSLRGEKRLRDFAQGDPVRGQASSTMSCVQSWTKIQSEISARRRSLVIERRSREKRFDSQSKPGINCMIQREEMLARTRQRKDAAAKRERAMAYAFAHQWRANAGEKKLGHQFVYEQGEDGWSWSWMDRWVAARPWEPRPPQPPAAAAAEKPSPAKTTRKDGRRRPPLGPSRPQRSGNRCRRREKNSSFSWIVVYIGDLKPSLLLAVEGRLCLSGEDDSPLPRRDQSAGGLTRSFKQVEIVILPPAFQRRTRILRVESLIKEASTQ
ncbi:unnamed protein product [Spirodela intermedia]|uniref:Uncharacterized protein n=1 Tax=Spirodela intermedia TaxID=51605 RepID=A0A7I8ISW9_SPIIN|nr:unnamed protein product [Spirodela intermedia]CAA6661072.1 unnamed protein product [Spirodela intermedia]